MVFSAAGAAPEGTFWRKSAGPDPSKRRDSFKILALSPKSEFNVSDHRQRLWHRYPATCFCQPPTFMAPSLCRVSTTDDGPQVWASSPTQAEQQARLDTPSGPATVTVTLACGTSTPPGRALPNPPSAALAASACAASLKAPSARRETWIGSSASCHSRAPFLVETRQQPTTPPLLRRAAHQQQCRVRGAGDRGQAVPPLWCRLQHQSSRSDSSSGLRNLYAALSWSQEEAELVLAGPRGSSLSSECRPTTGSTSWNTTRWTAQGSTWSPARSCGSTA